MNKNYVPRRGSTCAKALAHLQANPDDFFSASQLAPIAGLSTRNIGGSLCNLVTAGLAILKKEGNYCYYKLAVQQQAAPTVVATQANDPSVFNFALNSSGRLYISAAGSQMLLTKEQTRELHEYMLHTGSYIEYSTKRVQS